MPFEIKPLPLSGLHLILPKRFDDHRGFFMELYKVSAFEAAGISVRFKQDNLSFSKKHVLRGLHFQKPPHAQAKLVTVLQGKAVDVVVDLRRSSPTYGKHFKIYLDAQEPKMLFVPEGFAHGFVVLSESCLFYYKCSSEYHAESDAGIHYKSPSLQIDWEVENPIVSPKDEQLPYFEDFESPFW